jgi:uncharacterized protein YcbK (DUF882 family)
MNTSKYFSDPISLSQIKCPCGCNSGSLDDGLLVILDKIRERFDRPININSGFRCEDHNESVGGVPESAHIKGLAADIRCDNSRDRFELINVLLSYVPVRRIGMGSNFIHIDIDEDKPLDVMWVY